MTEDRRNDIGYKATLTVFTGVVAILLGLFIHSAWATANEGIVKASANEVKLAGIEQCLINMSENVKDIKQILKEKYK